MPRNFNLSQNLLEIPSSLVSSPRACWCSDLVAPGKS